MTSFRALSQITHHAGDLLRRPFFWLSRRHPDLSDLPGDLLEDIGLNVIDPSLHGGDDFYRQTDQAIRHCQIRQQLREHPNLSPLDPRVETVRKTPLKPASIHHKIKSKP